MKAIYQTQYGSTDVLTCGEQAMPEITSQQILVENHAASINPRDWLIRSGKYQMQFAVPKFPLILGSDFAGVVAKVGDQVKNFKVGDSVYGMKNPKDGLGAYAQFVAVNEKSVYMKPSTISYQQAAATPLCGLTAWQALVNIAKLKAGQRVLVVGASGGVGSFAVQIAKALGARVDAVCGPNNIDMVKALGAEQVFNYKQDNFKDQLKDYPVIFDTIGRNGFQPYMKALTPGGIYVSTIPSPQNLKAQIKTTVLSKILPATKRIAMVLVKSSGQDLKCLSKLIEQKQVIPLIEQVFPLEEVASAHDLSRSFRAKGKIILDVT